MSVAELTSLIDALGRLLGVLVWPIFLCVVLVKFGPALKEFSSSLGEFSFKGGGFEATAKRQQAAATVALVAATVARSDSTATPESAAAEAKRAADVVKKTVDAKVIRRAHEMKVLWVDDKPNNNILERRSLEALGISFVTATSTEEALDLIDKYSFDAIISDMNRPSDTKAGYTLLDKIRSLGNRTPFIIYAGSNANSQKVEARNRGALGLTNRAPDLFEYVLSALAINPK
jgi:CheY-like chemotaxis protein